jgi:hypothetical protein
METLDTHRERVAKLRDTLDRLVGLHCQLYELRSESWREQEGGDPDRAEVLRALHRQIDDLEDEAEAMRMTLRELVTLDDAVMPTPPAEADPVPVPAR